jgi:glutamate dehydrogenase (NAD(P)+)
MNIQSGGEYTPGVISGKPVGGGGSLADEHGYGVIFNLRENAALEY